MNNSRTILLVFGLLAVLLVGSAVYNVTRLDFAECDNRVLQTLPSPDGEMDAVLFERLCGEAQPATTHLSLLEGGTALPNDYGNAISIRALPEESVERMDWTAPAELTVTVTTDELIDQRTDYGVEADVVLTRAD